MSTSAMKILCRYQYDPLDRLTGLKPADHVGMQRFYQNDELVNEIEGQVELTILRHEAQPLAQRLHIANVTETTLLATDQQRSVLHTLAGADAQPMAYTAYGHRSVESGLSSLLGFNGERPDSVTGHYLLGQGHRAFNPVLMRFNSPDELSPFGDGGINAYAYCGGDPVNRYDPSGNIGFPIMDKLLIREIGRLPALNRSSRAIARPASQASQGMTPGPSRDLLQRPSEVASTAPTGKRRTAAQLPPENLHKKPHPQKESTDHRIRVRESIKTLRDYAIEWDKYVKDYPDTLIDADHKWHKAHDKALDLLEYTKQTSANLDPVDRKPLLDPLSGEVVRARRRVKREAFKKLGISTYISRFRTQT